MFTAKIISFEPSVGSKVLSALQKIVSKRTKLGEGSSRSNSSVFVTGAYLTRGNLDNFVLLQKGNDIHRILLGGELDLRDIKYSKKYKPYQSLEWEWCLESGIKGLIDNLKHYLPPRTVITDVTSDHATYGRYQKYFEDFRGYFLAGKEVLFVLDIRIK
jgi:hypothetical protein